MKKYLEVLKGCSLFTGINEDELIRMLDCFDARIETFDKKYTVFFEGNPAKYIGIVLSGSVQLISVDYYGNRNIISTAVAGELFGEAFACAEAENIPISVIANEKSDIMFIERSRIMHPCHNGCGFHNRLIFNLMKNLATKNIMFHQRIEITSKRTTREKLLTYLMLYSKRVGSESFSIPFDRQELADYLEVERSGLSAEISKLRREGVLKSEKRHFELL